VSGLGSRLYVKQSIDSYFGSGFVEEGRKRKANWLDGTWHDSIYMGILEEDWLKSSVSN